MRLYTKVFNDMRSLVAFINAEGIQKDQIVTIMPSNEKSYILTWYGE